MERNKRGITLIALVVTIVVLLILAGVSISMLTGENGIITQASKAKDETEQARVEELVDLAVDSLIGENKGSTSGITPQMIAAEVNKMESRDDVYAAGSEFPTQIIFPEEKRKVEVNLEQKEDLNEIYNVAVDESDIAPIDLFDYEIIDEAEIGSLKTGALPTKKARIIRIKEEYCNGFSEDEDTHYEINYNETKISDTLVIPYKVEINGEMYKITEVQLHAKGKASISFPKIETVIYPNTVEKIYGIWSYYDNSESNNTTLRKVILPSKLQIIDDAAFWLCTSLTNITIPNSVIRIGDRAFDSCTSLTNITIPNSVTEMGSDVFKGWTSTQTINVSFKEGEEPDGWGEEWYDYSCKATINYLK